MTSSVRIGSSTNSSKWPPKIPGNDSLLGELLFRSETCNTAAKQGFREFQAARRTIQGYKAMHIIRKGQVRWLSGSDVQRQNRFINELFEVAA